MPDPPKATRFISPSGRHFESEYHMKVYFSADMEGVAGVVDKQQLTHRVLGNYGQSGHFTT